MGLRFLRMYMSKEFTIDKERINSMIQLLMHGRNMRGCLYVLERSCAKPSAPSEFAVIIKPSSTRVAFQMFSRLSSL